MKRTRQCTSFNDLHFILLLLSKSKVNFMILVLLLWILEICCLLMPYSVDKLVLFSPCSNGEIITCLSFVEGMDHLSFVKMVHLF